jgi:hypothetical protein
LAVPITNVQGEKAEETSFVTSMSTPPPRLPWKAVRWLNVWKVKARTWLAASFTISALGQADASSQIFDALPSLVVTLMLG